MQTACLCGKLKITMYRDSLEVFFLKSHNVQVIILCFEIEEQPTGLNSLLSTFDPTIEGHTVIVKSLTASLLFHVNQATEKVSPGTLRPFLCLYGFYVC